MKKNLLLDGYNLAFRAFYAIPELSREDGFPTNAVHGWVRTLWYLEDNEQPARMVAFYDLGGASAREALQADYKAQRGEMPEALRQQIPVLKDLAEAMGHGRVEEEGVEADDLMAAHALRLSRAGEEALLVSADKDLAQILGERISQLLPPPTANPKLGWRRLEASGVEAKFGVPPEKIPDYLSLIGDTSDNIPGLQGVGPKTAAKWLSSYGSIEATIANCGRLKPPRFQQVVHEQADLLRRNLQMVTLDVSSAEKPLPEPPAADPQRVLAILEEMEMKRAVADARKRYSL